MSNDLKVGDFVKVHDWSYYWGIDDDDEAVEFENVNTLCQSFQIVETGLKIPVNTHKRFEYVTDDFKTDHRYNDTIIKNVRNGNRIVINSAFLTKISDSVFKAGTYVEYNGKSWKITENVGALYSRKILITLKQLNTNSLEIVETDLENITNVFKIINLVNYSKKLSDVLNDGMKLRHILSGESYKRIPM